MNVRCKFKCTGVISNPEVPDLHDAQFKAVTSGSPENADFWKWTPNGTLTIQTVKKMPFEVGKEYYLDISQGE